MEDEGNFVWETTGAQGSVYTNWDTGEPNNDDGEGGGEDCVQIRANAFKWNDCSCYTNDNTPLCEYKIYNI